MSEEYITKDYTRENGGGATELINDLVDGKVDGKNLGVEDFSGLSLDGFARRTSEMWQWLLQHMHNIHSGIDNTTGKDRYGIRETDFPEDDDKLTSVAEFINKNSDLSDQLLTKYIKEVVMNDKATINDKYWNESVAQLIDYFYYQFQKDDEKIDSSNIFIGDVKDADAGNNFTDKRETLFNVNEWVIPWQNICEKNYSDVRGNDKIIRVIKDSAKLQFTKKKKQTLHEVSVTDNNNEVVGSYYSIGHETDENGTIRLYDYLRLLMPEYPRIVEIEDLDRNFWVIGQVLTALCAFLFDDDGPLKNMFDGILDEICQLWENVFYLWLSAITETKENYTTIQGVFLPVTPYENYPYLKYDNFYRTDLIVGGIKEDYSTKDSKKILEGYYKQYLSYFKDLYKGTAICVVPEIRRINYAENYYAKATYLGFIIYDESIEGDGKVQYNVFKYPITVDLRSDTSGTNPLCTGGDGKESAFIPWSLYENEQYYYIARTIAGQTPEGTVPYKMLIRPHCSLSLKKDGNKWKLNYDNKENNNILWFEDVVKTLAGELKITPSDDSSDLAKDRNIILNYTLLNSSTEERILFNLARDYPVTSDKTPEKIEKKQGYYRGELLSWFNIVYLQLDEKSYELMPENIYDFTNSDYLGLLGLTESSFDEDDQGNKTLTASVLDELDKNFLDAIQNNYAAFGINEYGFTLVTVHHANKISYDGNSEKDADGISLPYNKNYQQLKGAPIHFYHYNYTLPVHNDTERTDVFYRQSSNSLECSFYTNRSTAVPSIATEARRAMICNPSLGIWEKYDEFPYKVSYGPPIRVKDTPGRGYQSSLLRNGVPFGMTNNHSQSEFYHESKDRGFTKDNWCIRYTHYYGPTILSWDEDKNEYKYYYYYTYDVLNGESSYSPTKLEVDRTFNSLKEFDCAYASKPEDSYNANKKQNLIIGTVVSTLFYPNKVCYGFALKRKTFSAQWIDKNGNNKTEDIAKLYINNDTKIEDYFEETTEYNNHHNYQTYHSKDPEYLNNYIADSIFEGKELRFHKYPRTGWPVDVSGKSEQKFE